MATEEQNQVECVHKEVSAKKKWVCVVCGKQTYSGASKYCDSCFRGCKPSSVEYAVARAIRRGELKPAKECLCVDCGKPARCYDHRDYNKPLEVVPVCVSCNSRRGHAVPYGRNAKGEWL